ncbi:MAG: outer membrane lipid asymmetry maintenance protein MlaD [Alphaproteobacteria bacterium]|jgi:phospholipid/cholesterol/gamma-HCH transport system substrate-binding protein|nr:outer membrane lipid asymmetry maintenance protein MlaD [Rickettsiaceae bacterium]NBY34730.1 outer membrane lipid asymmetry maintenance protein MlaD [Alphaproteobacteria bacterium]UCM94574.1 MAG: outer membrane lipid asymmetry maintenance protein MlaD [Candidatus Megaira endosymbiont of Mesostigma viride]HJK87950.1 outer membrane lipid asymmetry maintenance protein MlaD [Candidatus Megaira endosymbiont of Mesostigma viride]
MKERVIETVVGFVVICLAIFSFMFFYKISDSGEDGEGYFLNAYFQNIEGVAEGNDVKLSGIKIGYIDNVTLENGTYFAVARLKIKKGIDIPSDSRAIVSTSGLLGGKYIRINPGSADDNLKENGKFKFTQSSINIEDLISKLMYSLTSK